MKTIIYQMFTRLFSNQTATRKHNGTLEENGSGKFNDIDTPTLRRIRELGATHVWYTGVLRHATTTDYSAYGIPRSHPAVVKGKAGSPYAVADYYDVDPDLAENVAGRMREFLALVERTHKAGLRVVMDFVPNHVAREYHSVCCPGGVADLGANDRRDWHFSTRNNFYYCWGQEFRPLFDTARDSDGNAVEPYKEAPARATGNDCFSASPGRNDWYETVKLNYGVDYCDAGGRSTHFFSPDGRPQVDTWHKMTDILLFWAAKGIDAFRCDMAEMVPAEFWQYATARVRQAFPRVEFIGEVYNPADYRRYIAAGFDLLYDKVGMYDTLRAVTRHEAPASDITRRWQETDDIRQHMLYFLENHDEQRLASEFFAADARRGVAPLLVAALLGANPFMLYAGEELGERGMDEEGFSGRDGRTTIFDYWSLETLRHGYYARREMTRSERELEALHRRILTIARDSPAAAHGLSYDLMYAQGEGFDPRTQYAFLRHAEREASASRDITRGADASRDITRGADAPRSEGETLLVVANFADTDVQTNVRIPQHAFDFLGLEREASASRASLLEREASASRDITRGADAPRSEGETPITMLPDTPIPLSLPANSGVILRFKE